MRDTVSKYLGGVGLALMLIGAAMYSVNTMASGTPTVLLLAGAGGVLGCALLNARQIAAFVKRRSARQGANAVVMTLLFAAILVMVQAISIRNTGRVDLTRNSRFTLAPQTTEFLARLDEDVRVFAFYRTNSNDRARAADMLDIYSHETTHLRVEFVDPDRRPRMAEEKRARHGQIVLEFRDNRRIVTALTENEMTNALIAVTRGTPKSVFFVTGHNEKSITSNARDGYSAFRDALESQGYLVQEINLLESDLVPDDCSVLVVAGPGHDFFEGEAEKVLNYLEEGGSALFMLEPRVRMDRLEAALALYGIALEDIVLLDELTVRGSERDFGPTVTKIMNYENHPITSDFNMRTMFPMAQPIRLIPMRDGQVRAQYLALTGPSQWGETDMGSFTRGQATRDSKDATGPLPIAAVAVKSDAFGVTTRPRPEIPTESRVVAVGDSDFVNNAFYGVLGNADFALNIVAFLAEDPNLISIRPPKGTGDQMFITAAQGRLIFLLVVIVVPGIVIATGASVFFRKLRS